MILQTVLMVRFLVRFTLRDKELKEAVDVV